MNFYAHAITFPSRSSHYSRGIFRTRQNSGTTGEFSFLFFTILPKKTLEYGVSLYIQDFSEQDNLFREITVNMEGETNGTPQKTQTLSPSLRKTLLIISCIVLSIGNCGGPLVMRLYFIHGGNKIWLSSWLLTGGWPMLIIVLIATLYYRRTTTGDSTAKLFNMKPRLILASAVLGILTGVDNYLYSYGVSKLPVSTTSLVIASELAFTAGFVFLINYVYFSF